MKTISQALIAELHKLYNQLTGFDLILGFGRERSWYEYIKAGFTDIDLKLVITHLQRGIARQERRVGSLRFSNLIEGLPYFEEELALARALNRVKPKSGAQRITQAFRPVVVQTVAQDKSLPAKEIMVKLLEEMKKAAQ